MTRLEHLKQLEYQHLWQLYQDSYANSQMMVHEHLILNICQHGVGTWTIEEINLVTHVTQCCKAF